MFLAMPVNDNQNANKTGSSLYEYVTPEMMYAISIIPNSFL